MGFGGKSVAVTYNSLDIVRSAKGDAIDHVTVAATKDDCAARRRSRACAAANWRR